MRYPTDKDKLKELIAERFYKLKDDTQLKNYEIAKKAGIDINSDSNSSPTLTKLANQNSLPVITTLTKLCNAFGLDIDYFTDEDLNARTKDNQFIMDETGLTESAVIGLKSIRNSKDDPDKTKKLQFFSDLISYPGFESLFSSLYQYGMSKAHIDHGSRVNNHDQIFQLYIHYKYDSTLFADDGSNRKAFVNLLCKSLNINPELIENYDQRNKHMGLAQKTGWLYEELSAIEYSIDPKRCVVTYKDENGKIYQKPNYDEITIRLAESYKDLTTKEKEQKLHDIDDLIGFYEYEEALALEQEMPIIKSEIQNQFIAFIDDFFSTRGVFDDGGDE